MKTLLSGIAPSGNLHIGNFLGAIRQWVELQNSHTAYIMVADLHAITVPQDPAKLREKTLEIAALLIACGIDPKTVFIQSHVPAHAELMWILNTITPVGELERMTQFKDKRETAGVLAGLLNYPVLQAADILLYQTTKVPVGEDQIQHLELARELARRFNNRFGKTFTEPEALVISSAARVMGLDDPSKKMSKSAASPANYIALLDSPADIRKKIKSAVTDSERTIVYSKENRPAVANLISIYCAFSGADTRSVERMFSGKGYAEFKHTLAELLVDSLAPIQKKYAALTKDKKKLSALLARGAARAAKAASPTLKDAKKKVGLL